MKLSHHSKLRLSERANIPKQNQKQFFKLALEKGVSVGEISNKENKSLKKLLYKIESSGCKAKIYKGYIFIHGKNSKKLYTMYKLPEEYLESEVN